MIERVLLRDGLADLRARRVWRSTSTARLTGSEIEVLAALARVPGETVDRQDLLVRALGHEPDSLSRAVDLCVHRLRSKLEADPSAPVHLVTVQGIGYRLLPATELEAVRTNVPPSRHRLVGRAALLAEVEERLSVGPVALVGPAGAGKTRLADELARNAAALWAPAGAWRVQLAEALDELDVARRIAAELGVDAPGDEAAAVWPVLVAALGGRGPTLLVLDTCERVAAETAAAARALGEAARLLLTSRVQIDGCAAVPVPPLEPEAAVELLHERARSAGVASRWSAEDLAAIADAVDRLPLALELAAARLRALPVARLKQELERPLRLLRRAGEDRNASVEASLQWSWEALSAEARAALAALCLFRGPIRPQGALGLLGERGPDLVQLLVDAHLLREVTSGVAPWHAVREFAERHADPDRLHDARLRHASFVADWAHDRLEALWGPAFHEALAELRALEDDLNAALRATEEPRLVARLGQALGELDLESGRNAALCARTTRLLSRLPEDVPLRSALWAQLSVAEGRRGRWLQAIDCGRQAAAAASGPFDEVEALHALAVALIRSTRREESQHVVAKVLEVAGDDPFLRARALGAEVLLRFERRDELFDPAVARRALEAVEKADVERLRGRATNNYALALFRAGDIRSARPLLEYALEHLVRDEGRAKGLAHLNVAIFSLGDDLDKALLHAEQALEGFRDAGTLDGQVSSLGICGVLRAALGDGTDSLADLDESLSLNEPTGRTLVSAQTMALRAAAQGFLGRFDAARADLEAVRERLGKALLIGPDEVDALVEAWGGAGPSDALQSKLLSIPGDRRWLHGVLLDRCFRLRSAGSDPAGRD